MVQYIVIAYDDVLYHALVPQAVYRASQSLAQYRPVPAQYYGRIRLYARLSASAAAQGCPGLASPWIQGPNLGLASSSPGKPILARYSPGIYEEPDQIKGISRGLGPGPGPWGQAGQPGQGP